MKAVFAATYARLRHFAGRTFWKMRLSPHFPHFYVVQEAVSGYIYQARFRMLMLWLVTGILISSSLLGSQNGPVDVCKAASGYVKGAVVVRGKGQVADDGLTLASKSCPIAKTGYDQVPTVILVNVVSFSTRDVRSRFMRAQSESGPQSPVLDIEVRGVLNCQARMRFIRSGDDIVGANGFGKFGLYKCAMNAAELLRIEDAVTQPEQRSPLKPK